MHAERAFLALAAALAAAALPAADTHVPRPSAGLELFESDVRALLTENCLECHGGERTRARFDLTTRAGLLAGGETGPAVVPGSSRESPLVQQIARLQRPFMPPERPPLSEQQVAKIAAWIDLGAAYDGPLVERRRAQGQALQVGDAERAWWAFASLRQPFPEGAGIDSFVRGRHRELGLTRAPPASRTMLIRRLYFDVTGLPPEPADVDAFVADGSPGAYAALVARLLASPHFGERWARHWLDVARFAESHGFEHDYDRLFAFHYRDFVIRAFNADMPYDRFVRWQLAGDELAPDDPQALIATGFLAAGVHPTQITLRDAERLRYEELDDMLDTTGLAMLGLTVGCARCHDHKHDPIPARDYYRMLAAFTTTVRTVAQLDLGRLHEQDGAPARPREPERVMFSSEGEHVRPLRLRTSSERVPDFYGETYFLLRGDTAQKAGVAEPGFLRVLTRAPDAARWPRASRDARTSGRRAALARWITDVEAGAGHLLARVIVNRLWQHYFGRGIVATPNDFGTQGERPTHPELLDWLAAELIRNGWRLKPIHALILTSETYRMGGLVSAANERIDPDNRFLWRRPPRRLEAEAVRDNALAVSGMLDETMFGPGTLDEAMRRRSIYFTVKRSELVPTLQAFDWPDALTSVDRRAVTTTATQALVFMNDPQFRRLAEGFARRIAGEPDRVGAAYRIAYGRGPTGEERARAQAFVRGQARLRAGDVGVALTDFCAALMSASEFIYVE